jgi:hypothetical protein
VRWSLLRQFQAHFGWDAVCPRTARKTARSSTAAVLLPAVVEAFVSAIVGGELYAVAIAGAQSS